jgi:hypothetical protein
MRARMDAAKRKIAAHPLSKMAMIMPTATVTQNKSHSQQ